MSNSDYISLKIFSDDENITNLNSALSKLVNQDINIINPGEENLNGTENEILVINLSGVESNLLSQLLELKSQIKSKILFIIPQNDTLLAVTLAKLGFNDIFIFPYEVFKFSTYVDEIIDELEGKIKGEILLGEDEKSNSFDAFIGESEKIQKVRKLAQKISNETRLNILILGETGTGKGLTAKLIHNAGFGNDKAFVDVLCTAIPEALLESELFGYEKGAFTSAHTKKAGLFEIAEDGTLFLDEIGDLSLNLQSKLLRVIEKKIIRRLGGLIDLPVNARIISATNRKLEEMIAENLFRSDLFYRLNTVSIEIPPLRERREDIMLLINAFIAKYNAQFDKKITRIESDLENFILNYSWPGNVRELKNSIERAVLLSDSKSLQLKYFSSIINFEAPDRQESKDDTSLHPHIIQLKLNYISTNLDKLEYLYAEEVLKKFKGNKTKTSQQLGISRPKLDKLLKNKGDNSE